MSFQMENQIDFNYYPNNDEYEYSDDESVCSMNRTDFDSREQYMDYLISKGKGVSYDKDGYKHPKVNFCGYFCHLLESDFDKKVDPNSFYEGMWKNTDCYIKFWREYFYDFCEHVHPKSDEERLSNLYQQFCEVEEGIYSNKCPYYDEDDGFKWYLELVAMQQQEFEEFEKACEPEPSVKYFKKKPTVIKYIGKHQMNALPEHARKYFNQSVATNKTIKAPITPRRKRGKKSPRKVHIDL